MFNKLKIVEEPSARVYHDQDVGILYLSTKFELD